jgi:peptide/nickel transport system ATP-binding protein
MKNSNVLLEVRDVAREFDVSKPWLNRVIEGQPKSILKAVDGVSFTINRGETLSLVGESGCGKSTIARVVCGLYAPSRGSVVFDGVDMAKASVNEQQQLRKRFQMIFQDPYASLNPRWRVGKIIAEPLISHGIMTDQVEIKKRVDQLLTQVGLSPLDQELWLWLSHFIPRCCVNFIQHLAQYHLARTSMPPFGSVFSLHTALCLSFCAMSILSSTVMPISFPSL